jgi:hypothetical protein
MVRRTEIRKADTVEDASGKPWIVQALKKDGKLHVSSKGNRAVLHSKEVKKVPVNVTSKGR